MVCLDGSTVAVRTCAFVANKYLDSNPGFSLTRLMTIGFLWRLKETFKPNCFYVVNIQWIQAIINYYGLIIYEKISLFTKLSYHIFLLPHICSSKSKLILLHLHPRPNCFLWNLDSQKAIRKLDISPDLLENVLSRYLRCL